MSEIKQINENDFEYRKGDSGVKYLMRGPSIDWGIILLNPGEAMADVDHGHHEVDETFYFVEGNGLMIVNGKKHDAPQGSVFLIEPNEIHNIKNNSEDQLKVLFIKGEYKPEDKYEC
ncbi:MAG: cupin domain-containing protein [Candidatus Lokiarchaeota archaeon]|nr:cupin domain-containing protein [Candidatus Lokiarchaeota archaeon]